MDAFIDSTIQLLIEWGLPGLFISALLAGSIVPFSSELVLVALVKLGLPPIACLIFFTLRLNLHNILLYHVTDTLVTALKRPQLVEFQSQQFRSVYHIYHPVSLLYCERIYLYDLLGRLVLKIQICYTLRCAVT